MEKKWLPGKGFFGVANESTIDWLFQTIQAVQDNAEDLDLAIDEDTSDDPKLELLFKHIRGSNTGWEREEDDFGKKLFRTLEWADGADGTKNMYRFTLIITKPDKEGRRKLKMDLRNWYQPR